MNTYECIKIIFYHMIIKIKNSKNIFDWIIIKYQENFKNLHLLITKKYIKKISFFLNKNLILNR